MIKRKIILLQSLFISILLNANSLDQLQTKYDLSLDQWLNNSVDLKTHLINLEELEKELNNENGIKILLELDNNVGSKVDRYVILYSFADSMFIKKNYIEADKYIRRALEIYPGNSDSIKLKSKIDKK